ncbi:type II toxin-antitoxin system Phd/YefM family antitoxin [Sorangium sp. So ce1153]|uniref:type II toxin-antitoxin system Phd/YefM family antitoxin n=1 Tax=Sorangium sp. So ce1153 TaxID=3133333 RepID=UPI003F5E85A2
MPKRYSIAEARANLPTIVDEVEAGSTIELTRRGKPIAVVLSRQEYDALRPERPRFSETYRHFLERFRLEEIGVNRDYFGALRAASSGRKVAL